jgi:hypothetical protein
LNSETQLESLQSELNGLLDKKQVELDEQLEMNQLLTETNAKLEKRIAGSSEDLDGYQELMKHHLDATN